ncbi:serine/threonine-protein kinase [Parafrankia sp. FMc6]|uniref:serine/threonine-protein kinase n=1 Tax=Parafrankia soli TaxID=2599596 RepID=UPI0034D64BE5
MIVDRGRLEKALPGYRIGERLGSGRFGLVVAGRHRRLRRPVAIKVMDAEGPEGLTVDFAAEARILAGLDHPHVVRIFEYVEAAGLCLLVMELLDGGTLTRRRDTLDPPQACAVGLAVAAALEHAHAHGVLHRDIKADNILFAADGTVKVTDFGIAKLFEGSAATASGMTGTPMYMAPEQIVGGRLGPPTDLYSLGILLYRLVAGRRPPAVRSEAAAAGALASASGRPTARLDRRSRGLGRGNRACPRERPRRTMGHRRRLRRRPGPHRNEPLRTRLDGFHGHTAAPHRHPPPHH